MELTEEQKERIRRNRERALEIRRKREEDQTKETETETNTKRQCLETKQVVPKESGGFLQEPVDQDPSNLETPTATVTNDTHPPEEDDDEHTELEEFEKGASPFVTKSQAKTMYCLPIGTLNVCRYVEKTNPRQTKWSAMKLYYRSEIRRRARERFGGLEGLRDERRKRERKRFERDYKCAEGMFGKGNTID